MTMFVVVKTVCGKIEYMETVEGIIEDYEDRSGVNPFVASLKFEATKVMTRTRTASPDDFIKDGDLFLPKHGDAPLHEYHYSYLIDKVKSCRLFQTAGMREVCFLLDHNAIRMLLYISLHLGRKKQRIRIHKEAYKKMADISTKTYYNTINSLIEQNVMIRYKTNIFWINPAIMYSGDRLHDFPDKVEVVHSFYKK